jgi:FkbM family methyltransferase
MQHYLKKCSRDTLVVDVGANIGFFSFIAALSGCRVVSIEAAEDNVRQMKRTMEKNKQRHMHWNIYHNAATYVTGKQVNMRMEDFDKHSNSGNFKVNATLVERGDTYTARLDDIVNEDVAFMKIDIEGFEAFALSGAPELFCKHNVHVLIMEIWTDLRKSKCDWKRMVKWLQHIGYDLVSSKTYRHIQIKQLDNEADALFVLNRQRKLRKELCLHNGFS